MNQNNLFNIQAEQIILGSVIMNNAELVKVADILEAKHFYEPAHQAIWGRFVEMAVDGVANQITLKNFKLATIISAFAKVLTSLMKLNNIV